MVLRIRTFALATAIALLAPIVNAAPAPYIQARTNGGGHIDNTNNSHNDNHPSSSSPPVIAPVVPEHSGEDVEPPTLDSDGVFGPSSVNGGDETASSQNRGGGAGILSAGEIPEYVKNFAPVFWLHSKDKWFPSQLQKHIDNCDALIDYTPIPNLPKLTVDNLDQLNKYGDNGKNVFLTAKKNIADFGDDQPWLYGEKPNAGGKSTAPIVSIVVDRGNGVVDAFWMVFYTYNKGTKVVGIEFGNHVGDWEHVTMRFVNGQPTQVWLSQHARGQAFKYDIMEKYQSIRPVTYSALGSHAIYAVKGDHDHALPIPINLPFAGFVTDKTDKGLLWDPMLTPPMYFWYDAAGQKFSAAAENPGLSTNFLGFNGLWGDKAYPDKRKGQIVLFGNKKYGDGPTGPAFKSLDRSNICPNGAKCTVFPILVSRKMKQK